MGAELVIVQHLDDLAGRHAPAGAFGRHPRQFGPQRLQLGDLRRHIGEVPLGDHVRLAARPVGVIRQVE